MLTHRVPGNPWLASAFLAVLHGALLLGVLRQQRVAVTTASYLENWPIAEAVSLVLTPYFLFLRVSHHDMPRWQRALWLPVGIVVVLGVGGTVRFLRATWVYVLARLPMLWAAPRSELQASVGCLRAMVALMVLLLLATVFLNRPGQWPFGSVAGLALTLKERTLANSMAYAAGYFGLGALIDAALQRGLQKIDGAA